MAYYRIGKHHVFMTDERERKAKTIALADKGGVFRARMTFDSPERRQGEDLICQYLESQFNANPDAFVEEWVKFAFDSEQSMRYGWDLLYDYCCVTSSAKLVDIRSDEARLMGDLTNENFAHPMGTVFRLEAFSTGWFFKRPSFGITINLNKIQSIVGTPSDFVIKAAGLTLCCGSRITAA